MRWQPTRPWYGLGRYGKIRPVATVGSVTFFGLVALVAGLIFFGKTLSPLVIVALAVVLVVAFLVTMALTYGPANPPRP